jgi:hypothetical protein
MRRVWDTGDKANEVLAGRQYDINTLQLQNKSKKEVCLWFFEEGKVKVVKADG